MIKCQQCGHLNQGNRCERCNHRNVVEQSITDVKKYLEAAQQLKEEEFPDLMPDHDLKMKDNPELKPKSEPES